MKRCPKCFKTYESDDLNFCLDDGMPLSAIFDQGAPTIAMGSARATGEPAHDASTLPYAAVSREPERKKKSWIWAVLILGLVMLLCGGGIGGAFLISRRSASFARIAGTPTPSATPFIRSSPTPESDKSPSQVSTGNITMENFNKIKVGMSRSDVEAILGGKGEQISNTSGGGVRYTVDQWERKDYASIILSFENDKVSVKSQAGLDN